MQMTPSAAKFIPGSNTNVGCSHSSKHHPQKLFQMGLWQPCYFEFQSIWNCLTWNKCFDTNCNGEKSNQTDLDKVTQRCLINNKVTRGVQALPISKKVGNPCSYIYDLAGEIDNWSLFTRLSENQLSSTANFLEKVAQSQTPATWMEFLLTFQDKKSRIINAGKSLDVDIYCLALFAKV